VLSKNFVGDCRCLAPPQGLCQASCQLMLALFTARQDCCHGTACTLHMVNMAHVILIYMWG
jgi:hypothetical protein